MSVGPEDIDTMARTLWGESRGEPRAGKVAVAWVIKNRASHPRWWGDGIASVCRMPWQFSCWNPDTDKAPNPNLEKLKNVTTDDAAFRECLQVALSVIAGAEPDPTGGANHYHTIAKPKGAKRWPPKWAAGHKPTATIHRHVFYKL